jgi:hypothetical protein
VPWTACAVASGSDGGAAGGDAGGAGVPDGGAGEEGGRGADAEDGEDASSGDEEEVPASGEDDGDVAAAGVPVGSEEDGDGAPDVGRDGDGGDAVTDGRCVAPGACWRERCRVAARRGDAALAARATGTAGSVVAPSASDASDTAERPAPPPASASSVAPMRPPCGARMSGHPWNATAPERIASTMPPAAITDPDAPTTPAKARNKRIRASHR